MPRHSDISYYLANLEHIGSACQVREHQLPTLKAINLKTGLREPVEDAPEYARNVEMHRGLVLQHIAVM